MAGNYGASAGGWVIEDEMAAGSVIQRESILLQETGDLTRFDGRELRHLHTYIKCQTYKTSGNSRWVEEVENLGNSSIRRELRAISQCEKPVPLSTRILKVQRGD